MQFKSQQHTRFDGYTALASARLQLGCNKQFQCYHQPLWHLTDPLCIFGPQQRTGRRKSQHKPLHGEKQGSYNGIMLCLWDKKFNGLPLNIQTKITKYLLLKGQRGLLWIERESRRNWVQLQSPLITSKRTLCIFWVEEAVIHLP